MSSFIIFGLPGYGHFNYFDFFRFFRCECGIIPSRIILFGTIPAEILVETPTIPSVTPTLPHTSPFLYTDSFNSDTSDRPPSQDPYEILPAPPGLPRRPAVLVLPGQSIPLSRPYHTQPNGVRKMLTARKREFERYHQAVLYRGHSLPDFSVDVPAAIFVGPSRKRYRSPAVSLPLATPVPGAITEESYETYTEPDIDFDVQAYIDVDTAAAEAAAARKADVGVEVGIVSDGEDEAESRDRGIIKIGVDRVSDIKSAQREQGRRMLVASEKRTSVLDRIGVLERDNLRLRGILCVERERVDSLRRHMSYTQEELRQICITIPIATRTRMTPATIEEMIKRHVAEALGAYKVNINRGPTMESGDEREDDNGDDNGNGDGDGGGNGNENGPGGGNGDVNPNVNVGGVVPVARECTYKDFLKCQPFIFKDVFIRYLWVTG
ncbi:hypothetical protein Tco_1368548 [Tanacetum coccineum]